MSLEPFGMQQRLLIITLLFSAIGFTQQTTELKGKILVETLDINAIHILNKTKNIGTVNDQNGYFRIWADPDDVIVFSSVQFAVKEHIVTKRDLESESFEIRLQPLVNQLDEVIVSSHSLSGAIEKDLLDIPTYTQQLPFWNASELKAMGVSGFKDAQSPVQNLALQNSNTNVAGASVDLKLLVESISSIFSRSKNPDVKIENTDFFDRKIIIEQLDIPENQYYNFIDFINEQPNASIVLNTKDELKILEFLIDQRDLFFEKYNVRK